MKFLIITLFYQLRYFSTRRSHDPMWAVYLAFFIPLVIIAFLIYRAKLKYDLKTVENGVFKSDLPYSRCTLFEANLCLAIVMIKMDKVDIGLKLNHLRKFFLTNYPENYSLFDDRLTEFYNGKQLKVSSITSWLDINVPSYATKYHILYFLAKISMIDGEIINAEYNLLKEIASLLKLKESDLDSILNTYKYYENKKQQEEDQKRKNQTTFTYSSSLLEIAFKVLGLEKGATLEQVKTAYRKLAMIHHPDKFSTESEAQQKIAQERFIKINDAYEFVLKSF